MTDAMTAMHETQGGGARTWTAASLIGDGWRALKADPSLALVIIVVIVAGSLIDIAFSTAGAVVGGDGRVALQVAGKILNLPLQAFVAVGWLRYLLAAMRGQEPRIGMILSGGRMLAMLAANIVIMLATGLGLLFLIVPGVMLMCGWAVAGFCLVERGKGPIECLGDSWALTDGHKWEILLFIVFQILLVLGGVLCCFVGVFVAAPICAAASTALYMHLTGERPVLGALPTAT